MAQWTVEQRKWFCAELHAKLRLASEGDARAKKLQGLQWLKEATDVLQTITPATEDVARIAMYILHATIILCGDEDLLKAVLEDLEKGGDVQT